MTPVGLISGLINSITTLRIDYALEAKVGLFDGNYI